MAERSDFAAQLRWWRNHRKLSQLDLALMAGVSQRHVSFLEIDRTRPSRGMVARLADALDLPLRQQNTLLLAAGFAPIWRESVLDGPELAAVTRALDHLLAQQEPYPAVVVDRRWNLLRQNLASRRVTGFLTDTPPRPPDPAAPVNLADMLLAPDGLRPLIVNWPEVARSFVRVVQADAQADGSDETAALLRRLLGYPGVPAPAEIPAIEAAHDPVLSMDFVKDGVALRFFTAITTLGTPQDVTAQEVRIETFFPSDDATAERLREWADRDGPDRKA